MSTMNKQVKSNSKHLNSKYAKIIKKLPCTVPHVWTDKEKKKFNAALLKYGRSYRDIEKLFPMMTYNQIHTHA